MQRECFRCRGSGKSGDGVTCYVCKGAGKVDVPEKAGDLFGKEPISIDDQIKSVEREIAMRNAVYPRRVGERKMKQETADLEVARMTAVLATLRAYKQMLPWVERIKGGHSTDPQTDAINALRAPE